MRDEFQLSHVGAPSFTVVPVPFRTSFMWDVRVNAPLFFSQKPTYYTDTIQMEAKDFHGMFQKRSNTKEVALFFSSG